MADFVARQRGRIVLSWRLVRSWLVRGRFQVNWSFNMATTVIDGHNVIGRSPDISLADPDDEQQLLARLDRFFTGSRERVIVVFDAGSNPPLDAPPIQRGRVEARFARPPQRADDLIMDIIRQEPNPKHLTVISSDREILARARKRRCRIVKTEEFLRVLARVQARKPKRQAPEPVAQGDLRSETYLEYWFEYFGIPPEEWER